MLQLCFAYYICIDHLCGADIVTHDEYVWFTEKINSMGILRDMVIFS